MQWFRCVLPAVGACMRQNQLYRCVHAAECCGSRGAVHSIALAVFQAASLPAWTEFMPIHCCKARSALLCGSCKDVSLVIPSHVCRTQSECKINGSFFGRSFWQATVSMPLHAVETLVGLVCDFVKPLVGSSIRVPSGKGLSRPY